MSDKTITLPTPDGDMEFKLSGISQQNDNICWVRDGGNAVIEVYETDKCGGCKQYHTELINSIYIPLPFEVFKALIDAAQHPVCLYCKKEFDHEELDKYGNGEPILVINHDNEYSKCPFQGLVADLESIGYFPDEWLSPELFMVALHRSPLVIWQWLESLKEESND